MTHAKRTLGGERVEGIRYYIHTRYDPSSKGLPLTNIGRDIEGKPAPGIEDTRYLPFNSPLSGHLEAARCLCRIKS